MSRTPTTRLVLLRHAEVAEAYQRVFGGKIDMELSTQGHAQARSLAEFLRPLHFDAIYASPMQRVRQTVAPLAASNGYQPVFLTELREVDFGAWTGLSWDQVREQFDVSAFEWLSQLDLGAIPGAEPVPEFRRRVRAALDQIQSNHPGKTVAIVCHGGVIRMILSVLLSLPVPAMAGFEVDYASVTILDCRPHKAEVQLLNFTPWRHVLSSAW